jgi:hypothetical protein
MIKVIANKIEIVVLFFHHLFEDLLYIKNFQIFLVIPDIQ